MIEWVLDRDHLAMIIAAWIIFSTFITFSVIRDLTRCHKNIKELKRNSD